MSKYLLRFSLQTAVAAAVAGSCVFGEAGGCLAALALGVGCLVWIGGPGSSNRSLQAPRLVAPFVDWAVCVLLFAFVAAVLAPWASMPAVVGVLVLLSPLLGTQVYLIKTISARFLAPSD